MQVLRASMVLYTHTHGEATAQSRPAAAQYDPLASPLLLCARARRAHALDGTVYGTSRTSATSFYVHHVQRIALAAQLGDARGIRRAVRERKQSLFATSIRSGGGSA